MTDLDAWLHELKSVAHEDALWLHEPHPRFRYPALPLMPRDENAAELIQRLLLPRRSPGEVRLFKTLSTAFTHWLIARGAQSGDTVVSQRPFAPELVDACRVLGARLESIPRDFEDWTDATRAHLTRARALILSHPSRADGFYYPDEILNSLWNRVSDVRPNLPWLIDESLVLFSFNVVEPGNFRDKLPARARAAQIDFASSLFPALSPQGPRVSWWHPHPLAPIGEKTEMSGGLAPEDLAITACALLAFQSRQGSAVAEFQRKMLVLRRGLRTLTDGLAPLLSSGVLSVTHWPEAGFYLPLRIPTRRPRQWCKELFKSSGVCLLPGDFCGEKQMAFLCFAAPPAVLEKAAGRLVAALEKPLLGLTPNL